MYNISIIIPYYNSAVYLSKLLESIENYQDVEVIVVDDKSDENLKGIEEIKSKFEFVECDIDKLEDGNYLNEKKKYI